MGPELKSKVRIIATYVAVAWIFGGSGALMVGFAVTDLEETTIDHIRDVFFTVLPVATGIVAYWFASLRSNKDDQ